MRPSDGSQLSTLGSTGILGLRVGSMYGSVVVLGSSLGKPEDNERILKALQFVNQRADGILCLVCVLDPAELVVTGERLHSFSPAKQAALQECARRVVRDYVEWLASTVEEPVDHTRLRILIRLGSGYQH